MADGSVAITAGSGTPIRVLTGLGAAVADQQVITLADPAGNLNPSFPDGALSVDTGSHSMFMDGFDTAPGTSGYWTTGGTAPGSSGGSATLPLPTTISALSYMKTVGTFGLFAQSYIKTGFGVQHEATATTNNKRFWGLASYTVPTYAAPVTVGTGFLLDGANSGNLYGVIYSGGAITSSVLLTRQNDAAAHRYQVYFKQSRTYFEIDGTVVGSLAWPAMSATGNLNVVAVSVNNSSAASQATTFTLGYISVADTGDNASAIMSGDPAKGWVRANVAPASTAAASTDPALAVALSPNSPVYQVANSASTTLGAVATAVTLTLAAPGAGLRHYITGVWFERYVSVATTAAASAFASTAGNHGLVFQLPSDAKAIGSVDFPVALALPMPVQSTAQNTATTFTAPAVAGTQYRISVTYYIAP